MRRMELTGIDALPHPPGKTIEFEEFPVSGKLTNQT